MSWRTLTKRDLEGTLSQKELDAYRQSAGGSRPIEDLLERTAEMCRGYCRAGRSVRVPVEEGLVPESLISACCDYAAYDVLKRMPVPVNEDRRLARTQALELFQAVAKGEVIPESYDASADDPAAAGSPLAGPPSPPRLLD